MLFFQYFLYQRLKSFKNIDDPKLKFGIAYTIQAITGNIYDLAVIIDPENAIVGKSVYVSVMVGLSYGTAYGGSVIFFSAILHLLIGMKAITSASSKLLIKNSAVLFSETVRSETVRSLFDPWRMLRRNLLEQDSKMKRQRPRRMHD